MRNRIGKFVLIVLFVSFAAAFATADSQVALAGNVLDQPRLAADFSLVDQHGATFRMADTRGKVVLMAFIYTNCSDVCPFAALKMKEVYGLLGKDAGKVEFVAVTTDPPRDRPDRTAAYSKAIGMYSTWHFLGGTTAQVAAVWDAYGIGIKADPKTGAAAAEEQSMADSSTTDASKDQPSPSAGLTKSDIALAKDVVHNFVSDEGYDVADPDSSFWIVDRTGAIRVNLDVSATPADLVSDIRALLQ